VADVTETEERLRQEIVDLRRELAECKFCQRRRQRLTEIINVLPTLESFYLKRAKEFQAKLESTSS
jgi:hypothetical protein